MIGALVIFGCVAGVVGAGVIVLADGLANRAWLRRQTARGVVVHMVDGTTSIEGLLVSEARDGLVLRAVRFLQSDAGVPLMGEIFVPRARILMIQVVERTERV